jgi:hypothetical protein
MNYSSAVMLINQNIRAVKVSYDLNAQGTPQGLYAFKTLDQTIDIGDIVIVPTTTRHNFTCVRVEEIDIDVDFESPTIWNWIVGRPDMAAYDNILNEEKKWIDTLKAAEKRRKREELKKSMFDLYENPETDFNGLAITNMTGSAPAIGEDATAPAEAKEKE